MTHCQRPRISVIIPTLNSSGTLNILLNSLKKQDVSDYEVIIIDSFSTDNTVEIALKNGVLIEQEHLRRSAARNFGARIASSDVLLFIDSDMELTANVLSMCLDNIGSYDALCIKEKVMAGGYWGKARAFERDGFFGSLYFEAARCFNRKFFQEIGGYDIQLDAFEDLDLQAHLIQANFRIGWVDSVIIHHEEKIGFSEYLRKRIENGQGMKIYMSRYPEISRVIVSPLKRAEFILVRLRRNANMEDILLLPGLIAMRVIEFAFSLFC